MKESIIKGIDGKSVWYCKKYIKEIDENLEPCAVGANIMKEGEIIAIIEWKKGNNLILGSPSRYKEDIESFQNNFEYCYEKFRKFADCCLKRTQSIG